MALRHPICYTCFVPSYRKVRTATRASPLRERSVRPTPKEQPPRKLSGKRIARVTYTLERGAQASADGITLSGTITEGAPYRSTIGSDRRCLACRRSLSSQSVYRCRARVFGVTRQGFRPCCAGAAMSDVVAAAQLKRTPSNQLHRDLGARMVPFAGYEMPVQYPNGILKEHLHVRAADRIVRRVHIWDSSKFARAPVGSEDAARALGRWCPWMSSALLLGGSDMPCSPMRTAESATI